MQVKFWRNGEVRTTQLTPFIVDVPDETGAYKRIYRIGIIGNYCPFEPETKKQSILVALLNSVESIYLIMEGSVRVFIIFCLAISAAAICLAL